MHALDVLLQFQRRAIERLDMAGLPGPAPYFALINDPVLLAHPVVERRALFRREQVEVSQGYLSLFEKTERVREDFPRFGVPAENEV
jgi:hypothetical protein